MFTKQDLADAAFDAVVALRVEHIIFNASVPMASSLVTDPKKSQVHNGRRPKAVWDWARRGPLRSAISRPGDRGVREALLEALDVAARARVKELTGVSANNLRRDRNVATRVLPKATQLQQEARRKYETIAFNVRDRFKPIPQGGSTRNDRPLINQQLEVLRDLAATSVEPQGLTLNAGSGPAL